MPVTACFRRLVRERSIWTSSEVGGPYSVEANKKNLYVSQKFIDIKKKSL